MGIYALIGTAVAGLVLGALVTYMLLGRGLRIKQAKDTDAQVQNLRQKVDRLETEVNKGIFDILAVYEFTTVLGGITNLRELYNMMVDTMLRIVRYDACTILISHPDLKHLELVVARGFSTQQQRSLKDACIKDGVVARVLETGQPEIINNIKGERWAQKEVYKDFPYQSVLSIPFAIHGEILGVLNLYLKEKNGFNQDDLRILYIIANQAAFAIKNGHLYEKVAEQAIRDGLTGLYNHRFFRDKIETAVEEAQRKQGYVSMIMIDADEFKSVNDRYGHQCGDQVLKGIASLLLQNVRESDIVARYGGEEFAIILPGAPLSESLHIAGRIHDAVNSTEFVGLRVTVSMGLAVYPSPGVTTTDELISTADIHAYEAKARGKNQIYYKAS